MFRITYLCCAVAAVNLLSGGVSAAPFGGGSSDRQGPSLRKLADACSGQSDTYSIPALASDPELRRTTVANFTSGFVYEARPGVSPGPGGPEGTSVREAEFQAFQANNGPWILGTVLPQAQKAIAEKGSFVPTKLDDYKELYSYFGEIPVVNNMDFVGDDNVFARQMFTSYPHIIRRMAGEEALPFSLADADLPAETVRLMRGSLSDVKRRGHLYIADLSHLKEVEQQRQAGEFMGYPIALFAWDPRGTSLIPLAIQILGKEGPVYTKKDSEGEWLLAKIFFNNGAIQDQQVDHFITTHLAIEPLKIAAYRQLATAHPVRVLIEHYLKMLFGNNVGGFRLLFPKDTGSLDVWSAMGGVGARVLLDQKFTTWTWEQDTHAQQITSRGLGSLISAYDYYQDALAISAAVRSFVTDYLRLYYSSDSAVAEDIELTAWAAEASSPEFGNVKGFPSKFASLNELASALTHLIHLVTTKHHSMNTYSLYRFGSSIPFQSPTLSQAAPTAKSPLTVNAVLSWMPPVTAAIQSIRVMRGFARPMNPQEGFYTGLDSSPMNTPKTKCAIEKFMRVLDAIAATIAARASTEKILPYDLLSPKNMPHYVYI